MKTTKYLTMAAAALTLAACSSDELASIGQANGMQPVRFSTIVKNQTRAQITDETLEDVFMETTGKFYDIDGNIIENPVLQLTRSGDEWLYYINGSEVDATLYWPLEGTNATFSAWFYNGTGDNKGGLNNRSSDKDAVAAYTTINFNGHETAPAVALNFQHNMSKASFKAKVLDNAASLPLGIKVSIKAVTIQNVHYAATHYTPPTAEQPFGVFTLNEGKRDLIKSWTTPIQLTQTTDGDDETEGRQATSFPESTDMLIMSQAVEPQDLTADTWTKPYISVLAQVRIDGTEIDDLLVFPRGSGTADYAWIALPLPAGFTAFEPHKKYVFTLNFRNDAIGRVDRDQYPNGSVSGSPKGANATNEVTDETLGALITVPNHAGVSLSVSLETIDEFDANNDND